MAKNPFEVGDIVTFTTSYKSYNLIIGNEYKIIEIINDVSVKIAEYTHGTIIEVLGIDGDSILVKPIFGKHNGRINDGLRVGDIVEITKDFTVSYNLPLGSKHKVLDLYEKTKIVVLAQNPKFVGRIHCNYLDLVKPITIKERVKYVEFGPLNNLAEIPLDTNA